MFVGSRLWYDAYDCKGIGENKPDDSRQQ